LTSSPPLHDPAPQRRHISNTERARLFTLHKGICHLCGWKIDGIHEDWQVEHVIPWAMTRDDSDENRKPAHVKCHAVKTTDDRKNLAKADRIRMKHQGSWRSKSPMRKSR
jgi:5-methylcytosine-specific restriction protein A